MRAWEPHSSSLETCAIFGDGAWLHQMLLEAMQEEGRGGGGYEMKLGFRGVYLCLEKVALRGAKNCTARSLRQIYSHSAFANYR